MIALAALIHLPRRVLAIGCLAVLALHNSLDGRAGTAVRCVLRLWQMLHQQGIFILFGIPFVVAYPVLPWIALMAAGFAAGPIFLLEPSERRRVLVRWGTALIAGFVILRALNIYGDPRPGRCSHPPRSRSSRFSARRSIRCRSTSC